MGQDNTFRKNIEQLRENREQLENSWAKDYKQVKVLSLLYSMEIIGLGEAHVTLVLRARAT